MRIFRLLGSASCAAILMCAGADTAVADPVVDIGTITDDEINTLGPGDISELLYLAPSVSVFAGGNYAPEIGAGIKLRGLGDPRLNLSIEGSAALIQPGSVEELWVGSRLGFTLDDISKIEIVGSGAVGLIGGTPSYRFGLGGELPVLPSTDLFLEGTAAGHFGGLPTDIGIRGGLHFFPGRITDLDRIEVLNGPQGTLYGSSRIYGGASVTAVPGFGAVIPAVDVGALFDVGNGFDVGPRASLGWQVPAGNYEAWIGGEAGYNPSPDLRPYLFGEVGSIGGFSANRIGVGLEYRFDPSFSLVGEFGGRGGLGTISEFTAKAGLRYNFFDGAEPDDRLYLGSPTLSELGETSFTPYIGKSISAIPSGGYVIPSLDFGVNFPLQSALDAGLRGQLGYLYPAGDIEAWGGAELGYRISPEVRAYGFVDVGTIGGFTANRLGVGGQINIDNDWSVNLEAFGRGGIGTISEGGARVGFRASFDGLRHAFEQPPPPPPP